MDNPGSSELIMGWRTALLLVAQMHFLVAAVVLLRRDTDPLANRILAVFLLIIIGILTPQTIGFAGFYDAYPWLSFAPFANDLAIGPLVYAYLVALTEGKWVKGFRWMIAPTCLYFVYSLFWFVQPLQVKWSWVDSMHDPYIAPAVNVITIALSVTGIVLGYIQYRRYRHWLNQHSSASAEFDARWLPTCMILILVPLLAWIAIDLAEWLMGPFNYFQEYPFYILLAMAVYGLAQGALLLPHTDFPKMTAGPASSSKEQAAEDKQAAISQARDIRQRIISERWYLEPRLSLHQLTRRLASNETYLSRAINQGANVNFNRFINEIRVEAAKKRLTDATDDVLSTALECGFNSKATFNRVFRDIVGMTPSAYRNQASRQLNTQA